MKILTKMLVFAVLLLFRLDLEARLSINIVKAISDGLKEECHFADPTMGMILVDSGFMGSLRLFGNYDFAYGENGLNHHLEDSAGSGFHIEDQPSCSTSSSTPKPRGCEGEDPNGDSLAWLVMQLFPSGAGALSTRTDSDRFLARTMTPADIASLINEIRMRDKCTKWESPKLKKRTKNERTLFSKIPGAIDSIRSRKDLPGHFVEQVLLAFFYENFSTFKEAEDFYNNLSPEFKKNPEKSLSLDDVQGNLLNELREELEFREVTVCKIAQYIKAFNILFSPTPYAIGDRLISNGTTQCMVDEACTTNTFQDCAEVTIRHIFNMLLWDPETSGFSRNLNKLLYRYADSQGLKYGFPQSSENRLKQLERFYREVQPTRDKVVDGSLEVRNEWNKVVANLPGVRYTNKANRPDGNEIDSGFSNMMNAIKAIIGEPINPVPIPKTEDYICGDHPSDRISEMESLFEKIAPDKSPDIRACGHTHKTSIRPSIITVSLNHKLGNIWFSFNVLQTLEHAQVFLLPRDELSHLEELGKFVNQKKIREFVYKMSKSNDIQVSICLLYYDWKNLLGHAIQRDGEAWIYVLYQSGCEDNEGKAMLLHRMVYLNTNFRNYELYKQGCGDNQETAMLLNALNGDLYKRIGKDNEEKATLLQRMIDLNKDLQLYEPFHPRCKDNEKKATLLQRVTDLNKDFQHYKLYNPKDEDNEEIAMLLQRMIALISKKKSDDWDFQHWTISPITELYNSIGWEDPFVYKEYGSNQWNKYGKRGLGLIDIGNMQHLRKLRRLVCCNLDVFELNLTALVSLTHLSCLGCPNLKNLDLTPCSLLQELDCQGSPNLKSLKLMPLPQRQGSLEKSELQVRKVNCSNCPELETIIIESCLQLGEVNCSRCPKLETLRLKNCLQLREVNCSRCPKLETLRLKNCLQLREVNCSYCDQLRALDITNCSKLYCYNCDHLESLSLAHFTHLQELNCSNCKSLNFLELNHCLKLACSYCSSLSKLELEGCSTLYCSNCVRLEAINLSNCPQLRTLYCEDCLNLREVHLMQCSQPREISFFNSLNLKEIVNK